MSKVVKNKVIGVVVVAIVTLLTSVCFCALNWSYLSDCTIGLEETRVGILQKKGLTCAGSTMVDPPNYAGVTVYLKELDEDGDWVTVTAWEHKNYECAIVDTDYATGTGTFRLENMHKAYLPDDLENPVEIHWTISEELTID